MNNVKNIVDDNPPAKLQLTAYDQTISWEVNRSDLTTDELVEAFKTDAKWSTSPAIVNKIKPLSELPSEVTWYTKDRDFSQYFE